MVFRFGDSASLLQLCSVSSLRSLSSSLHVPHQASFQTPFRFSSPFRIDNLWKATESKENQSNHFLSHIKRLIFSLFQPDPLIGSLLFPIFAFILLYSILPHKELRFILIIVPAINACAAGILLPFPSLQSVWLAFGRIVRSRGGRVCFLPAMESRRDASNKR